MLTQAAKNGPVVRKDSAGIESRPTAVDLSSGCGGLTLGLKQAGFQVVGAVEINSLAAESYRENHSEVSLWEVDIQDLPVAEVVTTLGLDEGQLDLLAGCPPCEGFSSMRTLNGSRKVDDPRNDLVFEFLRFVEELRPRAVMMENVPDLMKDDRLTVFRRRLRELGYEDRCDVWDAASFGVPQRRRRMILLAGRFGPIGFAAPDAERRSVRDAIGFLPPAGRSGDSLHDLPEKRSERIMNLIRSIPKDGGSRRDLGSSRQLACHMKCDGFKDVYGRMKWSDVAPTITSGCFNPSKGRFLHPERHRAITLREAALLQTFPRDYFFSLRRGKQSAAALIGDVLPPEFVKRHAQTVLSYVSSLKEVAP